MPIYMDMHIIPGVQAKDVAEAHRRDMLIQDEYGCKCITYWIDEKRGNVFCLVEAPSSNVLEELHGKAHGLIPHRIIEVNDTLVEAFLGRISDPDSAEITADGLKVFLDPSFRTLLVTTMLDPVLLQHRLGKEKASVLFNQHTYIVRKELVAYEGTEVEHDGSGFIASFVSAGKAVSCALSIQNIFRSIGLNIPGFSMALHAGEPVSRSEQLFGDVINTARQLCFIAKDNQVVLSTMMGKLVSKDHLLHPQNELVILKPADEELVNSLFEKLEENWQDPEFNMENYGAAMAMSKSQLYRKVVTLFGLSPNLLLKKYRLEKSIALMKERYYNISQITFESGFSSPSYFTKCFKKQFGLLPVEYLDLLH
jgi:AraC-like DNA-binding protein